jgi:hypothetical protein
MPNCPQCTKPLREITRRCPSCQADLDLLVDYVSHLSGGLERAENLVKAGELGQAIWAYLEVLEVDPDNPSARKQIGTVVTAVRQFDTIIPGRRWANNLPPLPQEARPWWHWLIGIGFVLAAFGVGFAIAKLPPPDLTVEKGDNKPHLQQKDDHAGPRAPQP